MENYRESTNKDKLKIISYLFFAVLSIIISGVFAAPIFGTAGMILWIFFAALAVIYAYFKWHTANTIYVCTECNRQFKISILQNFISPNSFTGKLLHCPKCRHRVWTKELIKNKR